MKKEPERYLNIKSYVYSFVYSFSFTTNQLFYMIGQENEHNGQHDSEAGELCHESREYC